MAVVLIAQIEVSPAHGNSLTVLKLSLQGLFAIGGGSALRRHLVGRQHAGPIAIPNTIAEAFFGADWNAIL